MDETQVYAMIDERMELALPKSMPKQMMRLSPFEAYNDEGRLVKVIGVTLDDDEDMDFIVIRTNDEGEMFAGLEGSLWNSLP